MSNSSHHSVAQEYQVRPEESLPAQDNWLTIKQFSTQYPWPSESAMRSYVFKADLLGLQAAFLKVGRRLLVNPKRCFQVIQEVNSKKVER